MTKQDQPADSGQSRIDSDPLAPMLCFSLYSAALAVNRAYKPGLDALGITYLQYMALLLLRQRQGQSIKELGDRLSLDSNTLTPLIKRLEAADFVKRRRDLADERVVRVDLTKAGEKVVDEATCVSKGFSEKLKLTPEKIGEIQNVLKDLAEKLQPRAE